MGDEYLTNFLQSGVVELFRSHLLSFCHNYVCSDPTYFVFSRIHKDVYGDTSLRIQNFEMLVKQLKAYYQVRVPRVTCFDKGHICFGFALWGIKCAEYCKYFLSTNFLAMCGMHLC